MLKKSLMVQTKPTADKNNIVFWENYRVTVLGARLFRIEQNDKKQFLDKATQTVWFRNAKLQQFTFRLEEDFAVIETESCKLFLYKDRGQVCVELNGKRVKADNTGNLLGTYRTLDCCDGDVHFAPWIEGDTPYQIQLGNGVCSKTGVAVLDDSHSFVLDDDGEVKKQTAQGSDEYIFAFGNDYRGALQALYALTGKTPLVPRYALGNWWSRYHVYTDKEYLRVLNRFEEREIPLTVATVDMDWHYSEDVDKRFSLTESGKANKKYLGECAVNFGWTGYTWNTDLFPNPQEFLQKIKDKKLKITLNLHPSDGVRFWEKEYQKMSNAVGMDASKQEQVPFDFTNSTFINAYFDVLHRPHEKDGVDFWWIDWQQPDIAWHENMNAKYDPLWALNHYHYLDNATQRTTPLILSRYAGVGSHRYPIGFSGDTTISWDTLAYLPYFTATASNVGYTWWSHDIGGHNFGEKNDELYVRHIQYGVFSPINRLHCTCDETMTKEPWFYGNGTGLIVEEFLRFRHRLIPYLYTASYQTHANGRALVEPLYYEYDTPKAYQYKTEYFFGSELLVAPVKEPAKKDGFARVKVWIPEGVWTDIFTGDEYIADEKGKEITLLRSLDSIPVLAKSGAILPLSADKGNVCLNPENLEIWAYMGRGEYELYEDGAEENKKGAYVTRIQSEFIENDEACTQSLTISGQGNQEIVPKNRCVSVRFKNIPSGEVCVYQNGKKLQLEEWLTDCAAAKFAFNPKNTYRVEVTFQKRTPLEKAKVKMQDVLTRAQGSNVEKVKAFKALRQTKTIEEFFNVLQTVKLDKIAKMQIEENF